MLLQDYHIHTDISPDGEGSFDAACAAAADAGITAVAFTDHYDIGAAEMYKKYYEHFVFDERRMTEGILAAREKYAGRLKVAFGIEFGQITHGFDEARAVLARLPLDFIIASIHQLRGDIDFYFYDWEKNDPDAMFPRYLDEVYQLAAFDDYSVLGHLTYPARYIIEHHPGFDPMRYEEQIRAILKRVIIAGRGIEINTSTLRRGMGFSMPDYRIAKIYKELGGEIITIGSDAHSPGQVGACIAEAQQALRDIGFKYIAMYRERKPLFCSL